MDHIILNHGQVTWTTPELAPASPIYHTNGRTFQLSIDLTCIAALHAGSLVVLGSNSCHVCHDPISIPLGYRGPPFEVMMAVVAISIHDQVTRMSPESAPGSLQTYVRNLDRDRFNHSLDTAIFQLNQDYKCFSVFILREVKN
ncbi:hypothetical protein TNCV_903791 [Trichonephila clavipes]|nr:hypothetical protein TNCV_903791 [Trichonephila clavipes]